MPYVYSTEGKIKEPNLKLEAGKGALGIAKAYLAKDKKGMIQGAGSLFQMVSGQNTKRMEKAKKTRTSAADVVGLLANPRVYEYLLCRVDFVEWLQG